jgi:hypothetical protein
VVLKEYHEEKAVSAPDEHFAFNLNSYGVQEASPVAVQKFTLGANDCS